MQRQIAELTYVPLKPIAKFALTRSALGELQDLLQRVAENYDAQVAEGDS